MKTDAVPYVRLGTASRGGHRHTPLYQRSGFYGKGPSIRQFVDISLPSCVADHFRGHGLEFDQAHLYRDVPDAIRDVHVRGLVCQWTERDTEKYILGGDQTFAGLSRLVARGKQLLLIPSSPSSVVDKRTRHTVGPDWRQLFHAVTVQPFRQLGEKGSLPWGRIPRLRRENLPGPGGLLPRHGWRPGAITPELQREIRTIYTERAAGTCQEERQDRGPPAAPSTPPLTSPAPVRFSDLYTASLRCALNYPREAPLWMDQLCTGCMNTPFLGGKAHIR
ncbi:unnamed protein product [Nyctereutes procyonoides]|uniref:(raccoon dog) hypothetical protein n=1 Tax=Nyctereutes procyonoides TaxID=34880 RepID=A0A811ZXT4_NYCPR|nr:unnamed protein product [Nyctereutes procyonoides]